MMNLRAHSNSLRQPLATILGISVTTMLLAATSSRAVVIRHDVPEEQYLTLASSPALQGGLVSVLDPRGAYSGVLLDAQHILTVAHPIEGYFPKGTVSGPLRVPVQIRGKSFTTELAYLHPQYDRDKNRGGADLAVLRLSQPVLDVRSSAIWNGKVEIGISFVGVGQGKSGTGQDRNEPLPRGVFRGYENTLDFIQREDYALFRADFDDGTEMRNSLSRILYDKTNIRIKGNSTAQPLPLEGTAAAGDSGSGVWLNKDGNHYLLGICTYRHFSAYGGQAAYVNLTHPAHVQWLESVAQTEGATFDFKEESLL